jgi:1,2-dihydroxy-3-keto-5-methylthiopentene dioxygenase
MAVLTPLWTRSPTADTATIQAFLRDRGVVFEQWELPPLAVELAHKHRLEDADKQALLALFADRLADKAAEGYRASDVVVIRPDLPGVDEALGKFDRVHYHDDDEVRAIVGGEGVFGFVGDDGRQFTLTMQPGEYISLPAGMWHWFYCLDTKNVTALRLFRENPSWVPHYRDTARGQPTS